jgi:short-subunit dehydrogenase
MPTFRTRAEGAFLVTGAASGFGRTFAARLAGLGRDLVLWDRDDTRLDEVRASLGGRVQVRTDVVDVADADAVGAAAARAFHGGRVAHVIHCAGILRVGPAVTMSPRDYAAMMQVNYLGSVHVATACVPELLRVARPYERATLMLVASVAGLRAFPELAGYSASKHAVVGFAQALADELAGKPIDVKALCPPPGDTPMVRDLPRLPGVYRLSPMFSADQVVDAALRDLESPGLVQLVDVRSKLTWRANRLLPGLVDRVVRLAR